MIWIHSVLVTLVVVYAGGLVGNSSSFQDDSVWRIGFQFFIFLFFFFDKSFFWIQISHFVRACGGLNAVLNYRGADFYLQWTAIIFRLYDTHVCLKSRWRIDVSNVNAVSLSMVWKYHVEDDIWMNFYRNCNDSYATRLLSMSFSFF